VFRSVSMPIDSGIKFSYVKLHIVCAQDCTLCLGIIKTLWTGS
jgi:hypothetical protein